MEPNFDSFVQIPISVNSKGKLLVLRGTRVLLPPEKAKGIDPTRMSREELTELANNAGYFAKPLKPRQLETIRKLAVSGVPVETPVGFLKDGTPVFSNNGYSIASKTGAQLFLLDDLNYKEKITDAVVRMIDLGIRHGHLHGGNILIRNDGSIQLIDFSKSVENFPKNPPKGWGVKMFHRDIWNAAAAMCRPLVLQLGYAELRKLRETLAHNIIDRLTKVGGLMHPEDRKRLFTRPV